jgi:hypothetical protein
MMQWGGRPGIMRGVALLALALLLWRARPARPAAADAITVTGAPAVQNKFPNEIDFSIGLASSAGDITDVQLHYALQPGGVLTTAKATFDRGPSVQATYVLRTAGNPLYVPPTKVISYYWTAQDAAGNMFQTQPAQFEYDDPRFPFKKLTNGNLTIYYYSGSDSAAKNLLDIGRQALDRAAQLNGAPLDFDIHLVVYGSQSDVAAALSHELQGGDPNVIGQADPPNIVVLDAGNLTGQENEDTVRHELTHLVNARAVQGSFKNSLPLWLDEGLAVYAQKDPGGFALAVQQAIRTDRVVPISSLTPSFRGINPDLFYGEAWSITRFLATNFGDGKIAQLLAQFKAGKTEDQAFQAVYGMDRTGIYNAWRTSVGLKPIAALPAGVPSAPARQRAATQESAPTQGSSGNDAGATNGSAVRTGSSSGSGADPLVVAIVVVAGAATVLALLGIAVVGGLALSRRGRA